MPERPVQTHRIRHAATNEFVARTPTQKTRVSFVLDGLPVANETLVVEREGVPLVPGQTDVHGNLDLELPVNTRVVRVHFPVRDCCVHLLVGVLDPVETPSGIRMRLLLLNRYHGPQRGALDEAVRGALMQFQRDQKINASGEPDEPTRVALVREVGC